MKANGASDQALDQSITHAGFAPNSHGLVTWFCMAFGCPSEEHRVGRSRHFYDRSVKFCGEALVRPCGDTFHKDGECSKRVEKSSSLPTLFIGEGRKF